MSQLSFAHRLRATPFTDRVTSAGVKAYTVYNHMLLPTVFRSMEEDYHHLKSAVQLWDVSCERQVELCGPDAGRLAQAMSPRDLSGMAVGDTRYTPICDARGHLLNDPVTLKLDEERYWISIADSDLLLFAKGLAIGLSLDVEVFEPDVSPLAVQGPKAEEVMATVFGEDLRSLRFFGSTKVLFGGREHVVARSGYSGQGGYEIYMEGADLGPELWDAIMEAGAAHDIHAGCPNLIERIESGLLSYGNDMSAKNTLAETGLHRFCKTVSSDCIAAKALREAGAPERQIRYVVLDGDAMLPLARPMDLSAGGAFAGALTSAVWSPDFGLNVGVAMIEADHWTPGTRLAAADGRTLTVLERPIAR